MTKTQHEGGGLPCDDGIKLRPAPKVRVQELPGTISLHTYFILIVEYLSHRTAILRIPLAMAMEIHGRTHGFTSNLWGYELSRVPVLTRVLRYRPALYSGRKEMAAGAGMAQGLSWATLPHRPGPLEFWTGLLAPDADISHWPGSSSSTPFSLAILSRPTQVPPSSPPPATRTAHALFPLNPCYRLTPTAQRWDTQLKTPEADAAGICLVVCGAVLSASFAPRPNPKAPPLLFPPKQSGRPGSSPRPSSNLLGDPAIIGRWEVVPKAAKAPFAQPQVPSRTIVLSF